VLAYVVMGAFHGLNPAMGWLFAVALGLQTGRRATVLWAIPPITAGHLASVGVIVALVSTARGLVDPSVLRMGGAAAILAFGAWKLRTSRRHPRWVGMRVGAGDLALWSFLMSSAHGAGLMLIPVLLHRSPAAGAGIAGLAAVAVHTAAFVAVTVVLALLVYEVLGLRLLRIAWVNFDAIWAGALVIAGLVTLVV
jgi:hypothetical protein